MGLEARYSDQSLTPHIHRRPSGVPEGDLRSPLLPYYLRQRDALQRLVQKQETENQQLAEQVLAGRRQVEELQLQYRARHQSWQVSEWEAGDQLVAPVTPAPLWPFKERMASVPQALFWGDLIFYFIF